ncbi:MAG: hypothetical protein GQF41_3847 [Candidatus Rifleibacterium amylolyticum]|nr:MAG: hypothetical protein GQF41_3847 [Candidatus Rifleibacterium amylolyticum]
MFCQQGNDYFLRLPLKTLFIKTAVKPRIQKLLILLILPVRLFL